MNENELAQVGEALTRAGQVGSVSTADIPTDPRSLEAFLAGVLVPVMREYMTHATGMKR